MHRRDGINEFTLLCERCGYVIEGLSTDGACPECGTPIDESLPERRTGTPWQNNQNWPAWLATACSTLIFPLRMFRVMRFEGASHRRLREVSLLAASAVIALSAAPFVTTLTDLWISDASPAPAAVLPMRVAMWILSVAGVLAGAFFTLLAMTETEARGLRVISRVHGYRVDRVIAGTICAHGCVGWLAGTLAASALGLLSLTASAWNWNPVVLGVWINLPFIFGAGAVLALLAGFLFFETFAWLGLRRCRYANRARPAGRPSMGPLRERGADNEHAGARRGLS